jgi:hypothetical protein
MNKFAIAIMGVLVLGTLSLSAVAFAEPKNGWGEATSEEAGEEKQGLDSIGQHASDPKYEGPGNDEREGLGNTAEALTGDKNPDELGELLDCVDGDDEGDGGSVDACT